MRNLYLCLALPRQTDRSGTRIMRQPAGGHDAKPGWNADRRLAVLRGTYCQCRDAGLGRDADRLGSCLRYQGTGRALHLPDGRDNVESTLLAVNREAGDAHACVVATFGFVPGDKVADIDKDGTVVFVLEVKVMAVATVAGFQLVEPKTYYTVIASKQRSV